jgi:hypothetical protein
MWRTQKFPELLKKIFKVLFFFFFFFLGPVCISSGCTSAFEAYCALKYFYKYFK